MAHSGLDRAPVIWSPTPPLLGRKKVSAKHSEENKIRAEVCVLSKQYT